MIPTSDLRKWNLIKTEYGILPVHAIVFDQVQVKGNDGRILWAKEVEGVEINNELLLKFGYVLYGKEATDSPSPGDWYWIKSGYKLWVDNIRWTNSKFGVKLSFAHELQNLYYWIERKELTLKK